MIYKNRYTDFYFRNTVIVMPTTHWGWFGAIMKKSCPYKACVLGEASEVVVSLKWSEAYNLRGKLVKCLVLWWGNILSYIKTFLVVPGCLEHQWKNTSVTTKEVLSLSDLGTSGQWRENGPGGNLCSYPNITSHSKHASICTQII